MDNTGEGALLLSIVPVGAAFIFGASLGFGDIREPVSDSIFLGTVSDCDTVTLGVSLDGGEIKPGGFAVAAADGS